MSSTEESRRQSHKNGGSSHWVGLIKIILVLINILVLILEIALAGIALYLTSLDKTLLVSGLGQSVYDVSFGVICAGALCVIMFTIFGIIGTIRENRCFLTVVS